MTTRSTKLQGQFARLIKADHFDEQLRGLVDRLRAGQTGLSAQDIDMLSRLPDLLAAIDKSYLDHEKREQRANDDQERNNAELDKTNETLHQLNLSISAMFDTLDQGLFTFSGDGFCMPVYSRACIDLLEGSPAGRRVVDVLRISDDLSTSTDMLIKIIFARTHSAAFIEDFLALLPREFRHSKRRAISLAYRPIFELSGALQSILVTATDHTEEIAAQKLNQQREEMATILLRMSANRNLFTRFFLSVNTYFSVSIHTLSDHMSVLDIKREIHTLKGTASIFCLRDLVDILNNIETALENVSTINEVRAILASHVMLVRGILMHVCGEAAKIFGEDFDRQGSMRFIPLDLLRNFALELKNTNISPAFTERFISLLIGEPIHKVLANFDMGLQELAERYTRVVAPCIFTGENFNIFPENYDALLATFVHIQRNLIAHAIDDAETRQKWHKPTALTVTIDTQRFERVGKKWFRLSFTDDGMGINTVRVRRKLKTTMDAAAVDALSESDVMQYIFNIDFTTNDHVDELSGRGAGMSAIRNAVVALGGAVRAESELHRFTRITMEVPLIWL